MHSRPILCFLTLFFALGLARADLENFVVDKRAVYYQEANSIALVPTNGAYLDYSFDLVSKPNLYSASFAANLQSLPIQLMSTTEWRGFRAFDTLSDLQITYPNTQFYDFTTMIFAQAPKVSRGKFTSLANFTNFIPRVTNYSSAQILNPFFDSSLSISESATGLTGSGFANFIQLTIFDPVTFNVVFEAQYNYLDLTLEIPSNSLLSDREYLARVQFISPDTYNPVSATSAYPVLSRYLRETWLPIRTTGGTDLSQTAIVSREYHWTQDSDADPSENSSLDKLTAKYPRPVPDDIAAVTLSLPEIRQIYQLVEVTDLDFAFTLDLTGQALAAFTDGLIAVGLRRDYNATQVELANWDLSEPIGPAKITNWAECQSIAPVSDFTVIALRPSGVVGSLQAELEIRDQLGSLVETITTTVDSGDEISVVIPGSLLEPETSFTATLKVRAAPSVASGIELNKASVNVFPIATTIATWPGVASAGLYRGHYFDNGSGEVAPSDLASFHVILTEDFANSISTATYKKSDSPDEPIALERAGNEVDQWSKLQFSADDDSLNLEYPDGIYWINSTSDGSDTQVSIELSALHTDGTPFPATIVDTSYLSAGLDPSLPIPIRWSGIDASADGVTVAIDTIDQTVSSQLVDIAPDGQSGYIPANTLLSGQSYLLRVTFRRDLYIDSETIPNAELINGDEHYTFVSLTTSAANFSNWLAQYLTPEQLDDPFYAAPTANPDLDSLTILQEYALNGHPLVTDFPPSLQASGGIYVYEYQRRNDNTLLSYEVESSLSLIPPFTPYTGSPTVISGDPYDTIRASFPLTSRLFVQLLIGYGKVE